MELMETADGVRIAHTVHNAGGAGTPLVLSHGFSATSAMWDPNVEALAADRPVVVWDQRGHGDSDALDGYLSLAYHVAHPDRVAALVLVDTGPGYRNPEARARWNLMAERMAADI